jgi:hypothetical protein
VDWPQSVDSKLQSAMTSNKQRVDRIRLIDFLAELASHSPERMN